MPHFRQPINAERQRDLVILVYVKTKREEVVKQEGFSLTELLSFKKSSGLPVLDAEETEELGDLLPSYLHSVCPKRV